MWEYLLTVVALTVGVVLFGLWQAGRQQDGCGASSCDECSNPEACEGFSFHRRDGRG